MRRKKFILLPVLIILLMAFNQAIAKVDFGCVQKFEKMPLKPKKAGWQTIGSVLMGIPINASMATARFWVPGGWLVRYTRDTYDKPESVAMTFVPDVKHGWRVDEISVYCK